MATKIYDSGYVHLIDGREVYLMPLKIKYLREFMNYFNLLKHARSDEDSISILSYCALVIFKSQFPEIKTIEDLEENLDLKNVYKALDIAAGIQVDQESEKPVKKQATENGTTWETLDLAELESEVFLLGIWKDYEELETSLSMPELLATLSSKRDQDYQEKKFLAAIQGVDLDKQSAKPESDPWEEMKARVFSGGQAKDANDIVSFQGVKAQQNGFGVGMGLGYKDLR